MNDNLYISIPSDNTYVGVKAIAAGWGAVGEQKNHSCNLLEVELPVLSNEECRNTKYESSMIADAMLCAGYPNEGKRDTCQVRYCFQVVSTNYVLYISSN